MVTCKVDVAVDFATKCCSGSGVLQWGRCAVGGVLASRLLQVLCVAAGAASVL